jgi:hypothetical protein
MYIVIEQVLETGYICGIKRTLSLKEAKKVRSQIRKETNDQSDVTIWKEGLQYEII